MLESVAEKLGVIAENTPKVYEAGYQAGKADGDERYEEGFVDGHNDGYATGLQDGAENGRQEAYDSFWDGVQANGTRKDYEQAFKLWDCEQIHPKHKVAPKGTRTIQMFYQNTSLKRIEAKYFDFSNCSTSQTGETSGNYYVFSGCTALEEIEDVGMLAGYYSSTYRSCYKLKRIAVMRSVADTKYNNALIFCWALEDLTIEGVIGQNGFNVSDCPLTHDSLMSIINALQENPTIAKPVVTLGATNLAKLTDAEKAIATQKGWTLA